MLTRGQRIGVYEVVDSLGAGGMGEVYRARDTRLHREVALKVLPAVFAADPERMARFEREAQVLASLNHPHIATVYGFEDAQADGSSLRALAMELVPGETLADRLSRGALPIPEAIALAAQIAAALEAAHAQGIIHRDLKPANIHVTPTGSVKVLDFGLAKFVAPVGADASGSQRSHSLSPTLTSPAMATSVGVLLGTAAYMSPEQAKGREAGPRSDVWAFGCVLYEMLTGRSPFKSDDVTETLAAILMREPDWSLLPAALPINIERLLKRCLRRDPSQRLGAIVDARLELEDVPLQATALSSGGSVAPAGSMRAALPWAVAAVALLIAGGLAMRFWLSSPQAPGVIRLSMGAPPGVSIEDSGQLHLAISPDGRTIVVQYERAGVSQLFMRRLDQAEFVPIKGTERGTDPFFSYDGRWLAFSQGNRLRKIAAEGGAPVDVAESSWGRGTWGPDDTIVYTPSYASGLWLVAAGGGSPRKLTEPATKETELGHWWPQFLPDRRGVLFTNYRSRGDESRIEVYSPDTGERRTVLERAIFGRYVDTGHLVFLRSSTLFAVPFDIDRLATTGQPTPILDAVATNMDNALAHYTVSPSGTLMYLLASELNAPSRLTWIARTGTTTAAGIEPRQFGQMSLSPDERMVATAITTEGQTDVWLGDLGRGTLRRVTDAPGSQFSPVWIPPDGRRLAYASEEPAYHVYLATVGSAEKHEQLVGGPFDAVPNSALPDGQGLLYTLSEPDTRRDIWYLPLSGAGRKPRPLVRGRSVEADARISPDGRLLAYISDESGRSEVYVKGFQSEGTAIPVSIDGGSAPRWSADGRELFFRSGDQMLAVRVESRSPLTVARPTKLFEMRFQSDYAVARDGRFLAGLRDPQAQPAQVRVVLNWFDELRTRVPIP